MLKNRLIKILVVDDDEDDYFLLKDFFQEIDAQKFTVDWCNNAKLAMERFVAGGYDLYFVDYNLGNGNGLDILKQATAINFESPIILLTGKGSKAVDIEAMQNGATDYLVKSELSAEKLERSVRYSLDRSSHLQTIKQSEFKYRNLFNGSGDALFIADGDLQFKELNRTATSFFKLGDKELPGTRLYDFMVDEHKKTMIKEAVDSGASVNNIELELSNLEGESKICTLSLLQENDRASDGNIHGIIHDISTLKKAEKTKVLTEKLAANSRLVRVLAHEIRNPLNNINLSADHLEMICNESEETKTILSIIQRNGIRISQLITELLDSTRTLDLRFEKYSLQEIIETGLVNSIDRMHLRQMQLVTHFPKQPLMLLAEKSKLAIGFSNLFINAIEAMIPVEGKLEIEVSESAAWYCVEIKDNGKGIPTEQMAKLFEPFFTMKKNGMGLGLSAAYSIFKSHNAEINVESNQRTGTTFTIKFPIENLSEKRI